MADGLNIRARALNQSTDSQNTAAGGQAGTQSTNKRTRRDRGRYKSTEARYACKKIAYAARGRPGNKSISNSESIQKRPNRIGFSRSRNAGCERIEQSVAHDMSPHIRGGMRIVSATGYQGGRMRIHEKWFRASDCKRAAVAITNVTNASAECACNRRRVANAECEYVCKVV